MNDGSAVTNYTYDSNGNQLTEGNRSYTYNLLGQLTSVPGGVTYAYSPDGPRMSSSDGYYTYRTVWSGGRLVYSGYEEEDEVIHHIFSRSETVYRYGLDAIDRTISDYHLDDDLAEECETVCQAYTHNGQGDVTGCSGSCIFWIEPTIQTGA